VQEFAYSPDPTKAERIIVFRLREFGISGLKTEDEKIVELTQQSATAASASANAAKQSATSAATSVWIGSASLVIGLLAIVVAMFSRC
jgi:hypothetical protein